MNNNNQKISFVIPAYNCADTIEESIDSIFNGNFEDGDEIIIVNDASTDETENIITKLVKKHPPIIYIKNEINKGCPATRNAGISRAKNSLIFNLDSDNILPLNCISHLKKYLLSNNADIAAFSEYHYFIKDHKQINHKWIYDKSTMNLADFLSGHINPGPGGNFLYTKSSWQKIGGYWEYGKGLHEAWGFTLKQLGNGAKFVVLPNSYYFHRYGHDSLFVTESKKKNKSSLMATKMIQNFKDMIHPDDLDYITSKQGSITWFDNLFAKPIRLKNQELGTTGFVVRMKTKRRFGLKFLKRTVKFLMLYYSFTKDYLHFKEMSDERFPVYWKNRKLMLLDNTKNTDFDVHYILHPAWAARVLKGINPTLHIDISSTLSFCSIVSAFIPIDFYDYRPANLNLSGLNSKEADLMKLPFEDNSLVSLSCMHTVEHIGLGRYGDPLDPEGDIKAINELKRVTTRGGNLLFVTPIGKPKLIYNAHRIYSYKQIISYFEGFELKEFSLIPDNARVTGLIKNPSEKFTDNQNYGCGCFWFIKNKL